MSHDQGRPSLFAGMEDGATAESDTQRVRILSTLASSRGAQRPARKGPRPASRASKLWFTTFAIGVVALLGSFILIVRDQHPPVMLSAPTAHAPAAQIPASAIIPVKVAAIEPASAASEVEVKVAPLATANTTEDDTPPHRDPLAALNDGDGATDDKPSAQVNTKPSPSKPVKTAKAGKPDRDVELLEAVMSHSGTRTKPH